MHKNDTDPKQANPVRIHQRKKIELKPLTRQDPDTARIFTQVQESCERLNIFLADFIQTRRLLDEQIAAAQKMDDEIRIHEIDEKINTVDSRILAVIESMEKIAQEMPDLLDLVTIHDSDD